MTDPKDRIEEILNVFDGPNMDFKHATSQILELIREARINELEEIMKPLPGRPELIAGTVPVVLVEEIEDRLKTLRGKE